MRYSATIRVTDCMDLVVVHTEMLAWDGVQSAPEPIGESTCQVQGVGELDPAIWLRRALTALSRTL